MWTAKSNFSHVIEISKRKEHELITHGVYRYVQRSIGVLFLITLQIHPTSVLFRMVLVVDWNPNSRRESDLCSSLHGCVLEFL